MRKKNLVEEQLCGANDIMEKNYHGNLRKLWILLPLLMAAQDKPLGDDALRKKLNDVDLVGTWIYDDIPLGFREAKKADKPLLIVFR